MIIFFLIFQRSIIGGLSAGSHEGIAAGTTRAAQAADAAQHATAGSRSAVGADGKQGPAVDRRQHRPWWRRRGHLPDLSAQLRRRQRRRHRRPGRRPGPPGPPGRPRRRRDLVQPVVPVAAWPTPATTSPTTATSTRSSARSREAEALIARGARAAASASSSTSSRTTAPTQHPWFHEALAAAPGSPARDLFWFRPGRGEHGELPPNDWHSIFGGRAWTRTTNPDGTPGDWYLHLFAPEQPDLNWDNPKVREEFEDVLRFWFDRGVDGIRIDSAALLDEGRRRCPTSTRDATARRRTRTTTATRCTTSTGLAADRRLLPRRAGADRRGVAARRASGSPPTCARTRCTPRSTSTSSAAPGTRGGCATCIDETLAAHAPVGAPATWVLSNHDVTRHVTRYGREDTSFSFDTTAERHPRPTSRSATRRARAARCCRLALPGSVYLYQGEELGLEEVEDIPDELRQDPMFPRTGRRRPGPRRLPGAAARGPGGEPPFGFSPDGAAAAVAAAAGRLAGPHGRGADRRPGLDARALPRRAARCAARSRPRRRRRCAGCPAPDRVLAFARDRDGASSVRRQPVAGRRAAARARDRAAHQRPARRRPAARRHRGLARGLAGCRPRATSRRSRGSTVRGDCRPQCTPREGVAPWRTIARSAARRWLAVRHRRRRRRRKPSPSRPLGHAGRSAARTVALRHRRPRRRRPVHRAGGRGRRPQRHVDRPDPRSTARCRRRPPAGRRSPSTRSASTSSSRCTAPANAVAFRYSMPGQRRRHRHGTPRSTCASTATCSRPCRSPRSTAGTTAATRSTTTPATPTRTTSTTRRGRCSAPTCRPARRSGSRSPRPPSRRPSRRPRRLRDSPARRSRKPASAIDVVADFGADPTRRATDPRPIPGRGQRRVGPEPGGVRSRRAGSWSTDHVIVDGVTLRGAGPWYTELGGTRPAQPASASTASTSTRAGRAGTSPCSDLAVIGDVWSATTTTRSTRSAAR